MKTMMLMSYLTHFKIELCIFKEFLLYLGVGEDLYKKKKKKTPWPWIFLNAQKDENYTGLEINLAIYWYKTRGKEEEREAEG